MAIGHKGSGAWRLTSSARLLLGGGLALVVAGLVIGEVYALLLSHTINAQLSRAWREVLALAGGADAGYILSRFDDIQRLATERARAMSLHSHIGSYGLLAAGLALAKTRLGGPGPYDLPAAALILGGAVVQSTGFLTFAYAGSGWLNASNTGALLMLVGIALYMPGLLSSSQETIGLPGSGEAGGGLLKTGAVLVLVGLLFGLYLAWRHVFFEEPALQAALKQLVGALVAGDDEAALSVYGTYKSSQVRMSITAAAHSHAVAFGFIMIIGGLATPYLRLTPAWWRGAATLVAAGGSLLPVFVYLAPRYGYVYALCADTAGGLVILGLLVLVYGLIPDRGSP